MLDSEAWCGLCCRAELCHGDVRKSSSPAPLSLTGLYRGIFPIWAKCSWAVESRAALLCVLRLRAVKGHHPLQKQSLSAQEPRGAPARDDKRSQVPSLQVPADLHQHSDVFTYIACGVIWRSCLEKQTPHWCAVVALVPCPLSQTGGCQGAALNFSSSEQRSVSLAPSCPLQSSQCRELAST